jgi:hypothetical protein
MNMALSSLRWRYYGGGSSIAAIVIALVLGSLFLLVGWFVRQKEEEYGANGVAVTATVTHKDSKLDPRPGQKGGPKTYYTLHYRYQDGAGQSHEGSDQVELDVWNQFQKDQTLQIEYLRDQPNTSRVAERRSIFARWGYLLALGGGGLLICGALIFGIGGWFWTGRKARLVRDGVPILGIVDEQETRTLDLTGRGNREPSYGLRFTFTDTEGNERTGKSVWLPRELVPRWPADEPILVLQDQSNPARFEADIFEARAADLARLRETTSQQ